MEEAACGGDLMMLASEGVLLTENLSSIWRLRHLRDDDWASVVNFLQAVVAQVEFEKFTQDQCTALRLVLESHLRPDTDADDVAATLTLLDRAGFNPWRGISER